MDKISKYSIFELKLEGASAGNPFTEVDLQAEFLFMNYKRVVSGFYDGDGVYIIRFMPDREGEWSFVTRCNACDMDGLKGGFVCVPAEEGSHGPVRVRDCFHFAYDDGREFYPIGTTAYNWTNQSPEIVSRTIETLSASPFNKVRYSPFPKHYTYNYNEPDLYPYEGGFADGVVEFANPEISDDEKAKIYKFDFTRFNPEFWRRFESYVKKLGQMGIETDLIIFHPYDRWGFANMTVEENLLYLRYIVARLGAFSSVWWSMANEYDIFRSRTAAEWDMYGRTVMEWDASDHLRSIHNCVTVYDHTRPWITHVSYQRVDYHSHVELTAKLRDRWMKPFVMDEICYEGDIDFGWGNITGEELTKRFWDVTVRGGYCTHGETYLRGDEVLWWAKGGNLTGTSPERIAFLRKIVERVGYITPMKNSDWDLPWGLAGDMYTYETGIASNPVGTAAQFMLCYFSIARPAKRTFRLPQEEKYEAEIIDTWDMTIKKLEGTFSGEFVISLPAKQYIAVLFSRVK